MDRQQVRVKYNKEADTLFVYVEGTPSNTWNLSMNQYCVVRFDPSVSKIMGYYINSASKVVKKVVDALENPNRIDLVEEHFADKLQKDNLDFEEAKRQAAEQQAVARQQEKESLRSLDMCST